MTAYAAVAYLLKLDIAATYLSEDVVRTGAGKTVDVSASSACSRRRLLRSLVREAFAVALTRLRGIVALIL